MAIGEPEPVRVTAQCEPEKPDGQTCRVDPFILVIFGASGDLTTRKLLPALFHLFQRDCLPEDFAILGAGRTELTDESFRNMAREALSGTAGTRDLDRFAARLRYQLVSYDSPGSCDALAGKLHGLDTQLSAAGNWIYYLAIPPSTNVLVARGLGGAGLAGDEGNNPRIVVEKPFGSDLESARALDGALHENFSEKQVFRIDHYLAKETVQDILVLRFANAMFEPLWNRQYVEHVSIQATETLGVGHRAGYYEQSGVLRDMFQNHMMQLLALTAMEPPSVFRADRVQDEKVKVFRSMRPFPTDRIDENLVLGQYTAGTVAGEQVPGYRQEPGVAADSLMPTYARMRVFIDNWRWQGVPFTLISGKRLSEKSTEIALQFKEVPHSMFREVLGEHISANRLTLGIQPEEAIDLSFQTKRPGFQLDLRTVTMHFDYLQESSAPRLDGYAKVLLDCLRGEHMLFWRQDGVEQSWSFLTPVLESCESCPKRASRLRFYPAGSGGPR